MWLFSDIWANMVDMAIIPSGNGQQMINPSNYTYKYHKPELLELFAPTKRYLGSTIWWRFPGDAPRRSSQPPAARFAGSAAERSSSRTSDPQFRGREAGPPKQRPRQFWPCLSSTVLPGDFYGVIVIYSITGVFLVYLELVKGHNCGVIYGEDESGPNPIQ